MVPRKRIPDYQALMRPILRRVSDGKVYSRAELVCALADELDLSARDKARLLPSGAQRVFDNRINWAVTYLVKAGLMSRPIRAHLQITPAGSQALRDYPSGIDNSVLMEIPSFRNFRARSKVP